MSDDSTIDAVNERVEALRESLSDLFDEEPDETLPLLTSPGEDPDPGWWVENVGPLRESIEAYERKVESHEHGDEQVKADLRTTDDMLPDRGEY